MKHLFRPQRATLEEAMAEVREFDGTRLGLQALLPGITLTSVNSYYRLDFRNGWETWCVLDEHAQIVGFTNGPVR